MPRLSLVAMLTLVAAACTRYEPVGFDTIGPGYTAGGGEWNTGGGITAVARAFERNGTTVVCGAWTTDRQAVMTYNYNRDVMETGSVYLAGERLVQNLSFMARVPYGANITGQQARCVATSAPWRPAFAGAEAQLSFPRFVVPHDDEEDGGDDLVFRERPRPDILG